MGRTAFMGAAPVEYSLVLPLAYHRPSQKSQSHVLKGGAFLTGGPDPEAKITKSVIRSP